MCLLSSLLLVGCNQTTQSTEVKELQWMDLIPEQERTKLSARLEQLKAMPLHDESAPAVVQEYGLQEVGVEQALNNQGIRIGGFIVPLDGDRKTINEFILVPFFGACIHVPPPPANQMIHIKLEQGVPVSYYFDAVMVEGTLEISEFETDGMGVGYRITGAKVAPVG